MNTQPVTYVPKKLADAGLPPVHDPKDMIYMKFIDNDGKVVRVARYDPGEEFMRALYPTDDKDNFLAEAFRKMDDPNNKVPVKRSDLTDKIWIGLLDNEDPLELLSGYKLQSLGALPSGSYYYHDTNRTFHIVEMKEPSIEEVLSKEQPRKKDGEPAPGFKKWI